jgi:hypothetical protein
MVSVLTFVSYLLVFLTFPISIWGCVKVMIRKSSHSQSLVLGCPRIWTSCHLSTRTSALWRSQGTRTILRYSLHWHLQMCWPQDWGIWRASTGDSNQGLGHGQCGCCCVLSGDPNILMQIISIPMQRYPTPWVPSVTMMTITVQPASLLRLP